ncbi:M16 family metallopeptidase [Helicobacter sp. 23-1048]
MNKTIKNSVKIAILGGLMSINLQASVIPKHYEKVLDNGLQVVVVPLKNGSSVIEVDVIYKVGSRNEVKGKSGIAHMLEHLNFKSTKNLKAGEFDEIVKKFGGVDNASTSFDYTKYFIKTSHKNLSKCFDLFAEVMQNLNLIDSEFQPERDVVLQERLWRTDNSPMGYLYFKFFNTAFQKHSYHWTPIGFKDDIKGWKIEDIKAFHTIYYQPQNAIVLVAGDIEPNEVFNEAQKYFGAIKNKTDSIPQVSQKEPPQKEQRRVVINKESEVEYLAMGYKIPNFSHQDQIAIDAIAKVLSEGKSSFFAREIVDKKRLASKVYAYSMDLQDDGIFFISALAAPNIKAEVVEQEILAQIDLIKKGEISQETLEKIKINAKASFIYSFEDASSSASVFGDYLARGDLRPLFAYEDGIDGLSVAKLAEVAQKYFNQDSLTVAILRK